MNESTHVRYHHGLRPTKIEVRCPKCRGCAIATEGDVDHEAAEVPLLAMLPFGPGHFRVRCLSCDYRASGVPYEQLGPCFHELEAAGLRVWAWNDEHLRAIRAYLAREPMAGFAYEPLMVYVPGDWLRRAERLVRAIDSYLAGRR
ncbi:MAG: hypothetical protein ACOYN0_17345 [Phycisphaerales bacterium]